jgi:hypothetical protein
MLRKILTPTGERARTLQDLAAAAEPRAEYDHCRSLVEIFRFWPGGAFLVILSQRLEVRDGLWRDDMSICKLSSGSSRPRIGLLRFVQGVALGQSRRPLVLFARSQIQDRYILRGILPVGLCHARSSTRCEGTGCEQLPTIFSQPPVTPRPILRLAHSKSCRRLCAPLCQSNNSNCQLGRCQATCHISVLRVLVGNTVDLPPAQT